MLLVVAQPLAAASPAIVASLDDAYIAHDNGSDRWTIGSRQLALVLGFDATGTLTLRQMSNPVAGRVWDIGATADTSLTIAGDKVVLGSGATSLVSAAPQTTDRGVELVFTFEHLAQRLRIIRGYACYPGSPTIETWTRIETLRGAAPVALNDLVGWQISMPLGTVRWLGGLRGDSADNLEAGAFALASRDLGPGERMDIGSDGRSTEQFVPFILVDNGRDEFFGGVQWSGAWRIGFERAGDRLTVTVGFPGTAPAVSASRPIDVPHTFFGLNSKSSNDESAAVRQFILKGIRGGRPLTPLVTYNSWFPYGTDITEETMSAEMRRAAAIGIELFVVDAGWYTGAGAFGEYDFDSGLGAWTVDSQRFPSGLSGLAAEAHGANMKFGIWVEPERVDLDTVDKPGLAHEAWLATRDGHYGSDRTAQLCLAHPGARQWVLDRLTQLIDSAHADYLKWDNNFWLNCNRAGHEHGADDGNYAHVQALYAILAELRRRYPDLLIENVSGGGNRLDFGMLAYTDTAWMDDRSAPSTHVRHNIEGLTFAMPPAYLLSFVIDSDESLAGDDLPAIMRSRMPGILGLTYRADQISSDVSAIFAAEISRYKTIRGIIAQSDATLLSDQAPVDVDRWDVLQEVSDDRHQALIFAFKGGEGDGYTTVYPRGLSPDLTYDVGSFDSGPIGSSSGAILMKNGIEVRHTTGSKAHVLVLTGK